VFVEEEAWAAEEKMSSRASRSDLGSAAELEEEARPGEKKED
jgi:hypothetical protein